MAYLCAVPFAMRLLLAKYHSVTMAFVYWQLKTAGFLCLTSRTRVNVSSLSLGPSAPVTKMYGRAWRHWLRLTYVDRCHTTFPAEGTGGPDLRRLGSDDRRNTQSTRTTKILPHSGFIRFPCGYRYRHQHKHILAHTHTYTNTCTHKRKNANTHNCIGLTSEDENQTGIIWSTNTWKIKNYNLINNCIYNY